MFRDFFALALLVALGAMTALWIRMELAGMRARKEIDRLLREEKALLGGKDEAQGRAGKKGA